MPARRRLFHRRNGAFRCCRRLFFAVEGTANLPTNIMDFKGFDSSIFLILRGGILMSIGDFLESLSQTILVGIILLGRLGVFGARERPALRSRGAGPQTRRRRRKGVVGAFVKKYLTISVTMIVKSSNIIVWQPCCIFRSTYFVTLGSCEPLPGALLFIL